MKCLRNLLIIVVLALLLGLVSKAQADVSFWVYGPDMVLESEVDDVTIRAGYVHGQTEIGLSSTWYDVTDAPHIFGLYSFYHLAQDVNVPTLIPLDFLPSTLKAKPYIGGIISLDFLGDGRILGPVAGVTIEDTIFTEIQYVKYDGELGNAVEDDDEFRWVFGIYRRL